MRRTAAAHRRPAWRSVAHHRHAGALLARDARRLQDAGAGVIVLCTNTMHRVAPAIEAALDVPFLHIGDATARAVQAAGVSRVALLGTRFTMQGRFYRDRLEQHGLEVLVPDPDDRERVHAIIYQELVRGEIRDASRQRMLQVIEGLRERGAEGVIAGCTEIELLVRPQDLPGVPYFPTTRIHALAAVELAFEGSTAG